MKYDDDLYKAFLEEMADLENFRMAYASTHPSVPLERDDPDVKRLIEAMAFFNARTRVAGIRNIVSSRRRIFQQMFPFLLSPLSAMATLQAVPDKQLVEKAVLPKDSEIAVVTDSGRRASFRTLLDMNILPVSFNRMQTLLMPGSGYRAILAFKAPFPLNSEIGMVSIHINHMNDLHASQRVFCAISDCLKRAFVVFNDKADEYSTGVSCKVLFGLPESDDDIRHPLQKERLFFHYPKQELYINFQVPSPPRNWTGFSLCLDLDARWPGNMILNKDVFELFTTPIINIRRETTRPFMCDGTKESYPILHPELDAGYAFHSLMGVYRVEEEGMVPVKAGILSGGSGSYEIEQVTDSHGTVRHHICIHFPEAFDDPKTFIIDAQWIQPWLSGSVAGRLRAYPYSRNIAGVKWNINTIVPHSENNFLVEIEGFMHLLTLKSKSVLNADEFISILQTMGSADKGHFAGVINLLEDLRVSETPLQVSGAGNILKLVYYFKFKEFNEGVQPLVNIFMSHVQKILDAWISEATIEVRIETG